jgi:hypothetical protein
MRNGILLLMLLLHLACQSRDAAYREDPAYREVEEQIGTPEAIKASEDASRAAFQAFEERLGIVSEK